MNEVKQEELPDQSTSQDLVPESTKRKSKAFLGYLEISLLLLLARCRAVHFTHTLNPHCVHFTIKDLE